MSRREARLAPGTMRIININVRGINKLQHDIMEFVDNWARVIKTPVPHAEILKVMKERGIKHDTITNAIRALLKKGYIRRAVKSSYKTFYIQLKGIYKWGENNQK